MPAGYIPSLIADEIIPISPASIISDTQPALTRIGAGQYKRSLVASTTHNCLIPFDSAWLKPFSRSTARQGTLRGMFPLSLSLTYRVNTANLTSLSLAIYATSLTPIVGAIATPFAIPGAVTGATLAFAADQYEAVFTVTAAPVAGYPADTLYTGEAIIVTPVSSVCDILGAAWHIYRYTDV